jgi:hypothetical protein
MRIWSYTYGYLHNLNNKLLLLLRKKVKDHSVFNCSIWIAAIEYRNTELFGNRKMERWYLSPFWKGGS